MKTITIANLKGGSAKTTTTAYLAHAFLAAGKSVLAIDSDPQGSLLRWSEADGWSVPTTGLPVRNLHARMKGIVTPSTEIVCIDTPPLDEQAGIVYGALRAADVIVVTMAPTTAEYERLADVWAAIEDVESLRVSPPTVAVLLNRTVSGQARRGSSGTRSPPTDTTSSRPQSRGAKGTRRPSVPRSPSWGTTSRRLASSTRWRWSSERRVVGPCRTAQHPACPHTCARDGCSVQAGARHRRLGASDTSHVGCVLRAAQRGDPCAAGLAGAGSACPHRTSRARPSGRARSAPERSRRPVDAPSARTEPGRTWCSMPPRLRTPSHPRRGLLHLRLSRSSPPRHHPRPSGRGGHRPRCSPRHGSRRHQARRQAPCRTRIRAPCRARCPEQRRAGLYGDRCIS